MTIRITIGVLSPLSSDGALIGVPVGVTAIETTGDVAGVATDVTVDVGVAAVEGIGDDTGVATGVDSGVMPGGGGK